MKTLTAQDLQDLLHGACILGSGGGGPFSIGQQILKDLSSFPPPVLAPVAAVGDAEMMYVSAFVGSPDASGSHTTDFSVAAKAGDLLAATLNTKFQYVLPGEIGAGNSLVPLTVAVRKGIPVVDAAGANRAIPGFLMDTWASHKVPIQPLVVASKSQQIVITSVANDVADPVARGVIGGAFDEAAGVGFWPMTGAVMKSAAIPGMTSLALNLGTALRTAIASGQDPVKTVCGFLNGHVLFTGKIVSSSEITKDAFDFGQVVLQASDGSKATVFNQNENLIAWSSDRPTPLAMGPDLICYLTTQGQVFSNADLASVPKDSQVALIGVPAAPQMRDPFIVSQFMQAIANTGYAGPYVAIEQLLRANAARA
jgi:DUF917 family protein